MRAILLVIGYLVAIGLYISFILFPYYLAYSIIEPKSFFGVLGVFIFGSVIVPLSIWGVGLIVGAIGLSFKALADKKADNTHLKMKTVNELQPSKRPKIIFVLLFMLIASIGFIIYLLNNPTYIHEYKQPSDSLATASEANNEAIETTDSLDFENSKNYETNQNSTDFDNKFDESEINTIEKQNIDLEIPNLKTLGPSHLNLDIWFKDNEGDSFYMDFKNVNRPEVNSNGSCKKTRSDSEQSTRFSSLIKKELKILAIFECDNDMTVEASSFTEDEQSRLIMTLSSKSNLNRVFYSGEMIQP